MMHWLDTACPSVATLKPEDRRARHYLLSDATELRKFWNGGDSETSNQLQSSRSWGDSTLQSKRRAFAELVLAGLSTKLFVERSRSDFFVPIVLRSLCLKPGHVLSLRDPTSPCPFASDVFAREFFEVTHRGAFLRVYNQTKLHRANPCKQVTNALDCEAKYVAALTRRRPERTLCCR